MAAEKRNGSSEQSDEGQRDRARASGKSEQSPFAPNVSDRDGMAAEREYEDYALAEADSESEEPDVLLDVPALKVDEINLEVEELRARISLQAELLDLLRLHVGADVFIGEVELEIKGVEAQALLKVRLDNVARILDRALTTIDRNPQILGQITAGVQSVVEDVGGSAAKTVGELGEGAGAAVEKVGEDAGTAIEATGETARRAAKDAGQTTRRAVGRDGKPVKKARGTAKKDSEEGTATRSRATREAGASGGRDRRSSRRTGASDDRSPTT